MAWRSKRIRRFLFFIILPFLIASPLFADGEKLEKKETEEEGKPSEKEWKFEAGGQIRLRGEKVHNLSFTDFAFIPGHSEAQLLQRTRLQVSVENHALNLEAVLQLQWYGRWGGKKDRSSIDPYQGYIQWEKILGSPLSLKAGRQEISYGSFFFIGPNDFYNGLSWDGLKANIAPLELLSVDILGAKMVKLNSKDPNIWLGGLYATYKIYKEGALDAYLFYNRGGFPISHREFVLLDSGQKWFTLGTRFSGKVEGFNYELEPQFQWGKVKQAKRDGRDSVRAYGGHLDLGYTFQLPSNPRIFGAYAYGSGDNNPLDGKYREFHGTIFNDASSLLGEMKVISDLSGVTVDRTRASGIHLWVAGITITPLSDLEVTLRFHRFLASKVPSSFSKDLGAEFDLSISYKLTKTMAFLVGLEKFYTRAFFDQASRSKKNIDYIYIQGQVDF